MKQCGTASRKVSTLFGSLCGILVIVFWQCNVSKVRQYAMYYLRFTVLVKMTVTESERQIQASWNKHETIRTIIPPEDLPGIIFSFFVDYSQQVSHRFISAKCVQCPTVSNATYPSPYGDIQQAFYNQ